MALGLRHDISIEGVGSLRITTENVATIEMIDHNRVSIQLASNKEADRMATDFADDSGEGMLEEDSPFQKYEQLRQFCP